VAHSVPTAWIRPPSTGRTFEVPIAEFVRIVDGRIASSISYWDDALFASQLGLGAGGAA
jgi:ketosteroid isomerase-like protein